MKNLTIRGNMGSDLNNKATFQVSVKNDYKLGGKKLYF